MTGPNGPNSRVIELPPDSSHGPHINGSGAQQPPQPPPTEEQPHLGPNTPRLGVKRHKARITIASLNIRGGGSTSTRTKWNHINQIMRDRRIGILAIQETHLSETDVASIHDQFPSRLSIHNTGDPEQPNARAGVAIVLNKHLTSWKEALVDIIIPGRALLMRLPWRKGSLLNILAIYAPNTAADNATFWETLIEKWNEQNLPAPDIMLGDFNIVEEAIDRLPAHRDSERAVTSLQAFKQTIGMRDEWRAMNPTKLSYTYTQTATQSRSRIDRIYTTAPLQKCVRNWQIQPPPINSDHFIVSMEVSNPGAPWIGKGRWAIPAHILRQRKVLQEIKERGLQTMQRIRDLNNSERTQRNIQREYASFKRGVILYAKAYAKIATPILDTKIGNLRKELDTTLNNRNMSVEEIQTNAGLIEERIRQLETMRHAKTRDNVAVRGALEGEQITKFWIQVNKDRKPRDTIPALRRLDSPPDNPVFEKKTENMAAIAHEYHNGLQTEGLVQNLTDDEFAEVLNHLTPSVSPAEKNELAKYMTREEVQQAIKALPDGKAPGVDGIPHELWKILDEKYKTDSKHGNPAFDVIDLLHLVYNDIEKYGVDPELGFSNGWMCPIYKKGETTEISNYRPITVLNSDYKIMTRVLTTRITGVVSNLIHPDQAGFMKGRSITDQTDLVQLMLDRCEVEEENGVVVCLDQEKAYDKIRHDFIWKTLDKLNFPKHFTNTVRSLYEDGRTVVIVNGEISRPYAVKRGVRQGDPLSCLIFNLAIESLAQMLRDSNLEGFKIDGETTRLITTLFADDTTVYLSQNDSYTDLMDILNKWCRVSGAKFNIQKTVILPIGSEEYRNTVVTTRKINPASPNTLSNEIKIAADGTPVRILGAFVGNRTSNLAIWTPTIEKLSLHLERWAKSRPTLDGKKLIVGMEVGGLTQYLTRVQGMSKEVEKEITKMTTKFLWDHASPMVNIETLQLPIEQGGKGLLDLSARNEAIDLMHLKSYLNLGPERPRWAKIADYFIAKNIPTDQNVLPEGRKANIFTQSWTTKLRNKSSLPENIKSMLKTAEKYNVTLEPLLPSGALKREIPIWHHKGVNPTARTVRILTNQWAICQRRNHNITTAGEMMDFSSVELGTRHRPRCNCACTWCKDKRRLGCANPHKCRQTAEKILDSLLPVWDPRRNLNHDDLDKTNEDVTTYLPPGTHLHNLTTFNPSITSSGSLKDEFRVLQDCPLDNPGPRLRHEKTLFGPPNCVTVYIEGFGTNAKTQQARAAGCAWYSENDERNYTRRVANPKETDLQGAIEALQHVVKTLPMDTELRVLSSLRPLIRMLTTRLPIAESTGWRGTHVTEETKALVTSLRKRNAKTYLQEVSKTEMSFIEGITSARNLARNTLQNEKPEQVLGDDVSYVNSGICLAKAGQSLLYNAITNRKAQQTEQRRAAKVSLDITRYAVEELTSKCPDDELIWTSMRKKDIAKKIRAFLWKVAHGAYKVGEYWRNIPGYEIRGHCHICGVEETMDHILTECRASGQATIWTLAEELWSLRGLNWLRPNLGRILGCGLAAYSPEKNKSKLTGANRLYAILVSESAYLIWKIRCEWKIQNKGEENKILSPEVLRNKWVATLNRRLKLDCLSTNRYRYGSKALRPSLVQKTWWGVLMDQGNLADDWSKTAEVLVGVGMSLPTGRRRGVG